METRPREVNTGHLKASAVISPGEDSLSLSSACSLRVRVRSDNEVEMILDSVTFHGTVRMITKQFIFQCLLLQVETLKDSNLTPHRSELWEHD